MAMITEIEDFFTLGCGRCVRFATPDCSVRKWSAGVDALREICRGLGLQETVKWGHPCYMHAGRNIAIIGAFRGDFRLTFMNATLLKDPEGVLDRQGPDTQNSDAIRFTDLVDVGAKAAVIRAYLAEAMGYAAAGIKAEKVIREIELPEEMVGAMDADPELAEAFHALTPGRQNSYVIVLKGAKAAATRVARIEKFRAKIIAGKGANEY
jgi:uncharacterized protein YdeI (YjbR/CyaY-like superfamily)